MGSVHVSLSIPNIFFEDNPDIEVYLEERRQWQEKKDEMISSWLRERQRIVAEEIVEKETEGDHFVLLLLPLPALL